MKKNVNLSKYLPAPSPALIVTTPFKANGHTIMSTTYVGAKTLVDDNRKTKI